MKKLVIFDLDGTLLNTIADLAQSTNHALNVLGYPTHEESAYNFMVGNGINKLFERALPETAKNEENVLRVRKEFIPYYDAHNADKSHPYPGIPELLEQIQSQGLQIAVASNKYQAATQKLIAHYFPKIHFVAVFGQREGVNVKPDPTIVEDILTIAKTDKRDVLYVGDSGVDMQTAINAGVTSCGTAGRPDVHDHRAQKPQSTAVSGASGVDGAHRIPAHRLSRTVSVQPLQNGL